MKFRKLSFASSVLACLLATAAGAGAARAEGGSEAGPAFRPHLSWGQPDGILQLQIPTDWEINPRLAEDNNAFGFLHPSGMKPGQEIPVWVLLEHRARHSDLPFDRFVEDCLEEGRPLGFLRQDSTVVTTADGRRLLSYRFNPSEEGAQRALGLLETPRGAILFRQQAVDAETWDARIEAIRSILSSVRFLPRPELRGRR